MPLDQIDQTVDAASRIARAAVPVDAGWVGQHDLRVSGWFSHARGELCPGFSVGAGDTLLDAGCTDPVPLRFCAWRGAAITLADSDPARLQRAADAAGVAGTRARAVRSDATPLPFPAQTFNRVLSQDVLQHLDDPAAYLEELARVGEPGALYLLSVPDPMAETVLTRLAPQAYFEKPNHARIIGRDAFTRMVESAGLIVERRHYHGSFWSLWWLIYAALELPLESAPQHPALEHWSRCWASILACVQGGKVKRVLDGFLPKSQVIVARKPGTALPHPVLAAPPAPPPDDPAELLFDPGDNLPMPDLSYLALKDAAWAGWFDNATGELFTGYRVGPEHRVLDLGCGDGGTLAFCARVGAYVILADIDEAKVAQATSLIAGITPDRHEAYVTDASPLPLPDACVDRVICTEVLEHVDDPAAVLDELVRVGQPGALYLLSVPDPVQENLQIGLAPPSYFEKPNHLRIFGRDDFTALVEQSGLVIERHGHYGGFFAVWWLMFWTCQIPLEGDRRHPVLDNWARTWDSVLAAPKGRQFKHLLDATIPKSQLIIARKPA